MSKYSVLFVVVTFTLSGVNTENGMRFDAVLNLLNDFNTNDQNYGIYKRSHAFDNFYDNSLNYIYDDRQRALSREAIRRLIHEGSKSRRQNPSNVDKEQRMILDFINLQNPKTSNRIESTNKRVRFHPKIHGDSSYKRDTENIFGNSNLISKLQGSHSTEDVNNFRGRYKKDSSDVFVVLNPEDSENNNVINDIISSILYSSLGYQKSRSTMDQHNKGFLEYDGLYSRRFRPGSDEMYASKDSLEDYRPKRSRGDRPAGRTAIPYISHRGDIYERD